MNNYNDFYGFMSEYTEMFEGIEKKEEAKLKALYSRDLTKINEILTEHQKTEKLVSDYEKKRLQLHEKLGLSGKTFKEIIDAENGEFKTELQSLYNRLRISVRNTKRYNQKSLEFSQMNLDIIRQINDSGLSDPQCYNSKGITNTSKKDIPTFVNTKI